MYSNICHGIFLQINFIDIAYYVTSCFVGLFVLLKQVSVRFVLQRRHRLIITCGDD